MTQKKADTLAGQGSENSGTGKCVSGKQADKSAGWEQKMHDFLAIVRVCPFIGESFGYDPSSADGYEFERTFSHVATFVKISFF